MTSSRDRETISVDADLSIPVNGDATFLQGPFPHRESMNSPLQSKKLRIHSNEALVHDRINFAP